MSKRALVLLALALLGGVLWRWPLAAQPTTTPKAAPEVSNRRAQLAGDGKADDTAALQAQFAAGGKVNLPAGTYRITRSLLLELDRVGPVAIEGDATVRIVMEGAGPALKLVGTHGGTAAPHTVRDEIWRRQRTPQIDGIEIVGAHPEADGIKLTGTMQPTLTRLTVRRCRHALHLTGRNRNVTIGECHLYDNTGVGIYLNGLNLHQIDIANCHISYNGGGGIVVRRSEIRNLQIGTCDIEGNMDPDGPPTANVLLDASEGSIREGALIGCTIQHTHEAPGSANVRLIGRSDEPHKVGHFCISDNAMSDVAINIELRHARGVVITGNTLWKGFEHNLLAVNCSNLVLGPGAYDRNPDYRPADSANTLVFRDCRDSTLSGLHINHTLGKPAALLLESCRRFQVTGCTILDCAPVGLLLRDVHDSRVSACLIRNDLADSQSVPMQVEGGSGNKIDE